MLNRLRVLILFGPLFLITCSVDITATSPIDNVAKEAIVQPFPSSTLQIEKRDRTKPTATLTYEALNVLTRTEGFLLPELEKISSSNIDLIENIIDLNLGETNNGYAQNVLSLSFSFDSRLLATPGSDGIVRVWDMQAGALVYELEGPRGQGYYREVDFSPIDYTLLFWGDNTAQIWNAYSGDLLETIIMGDDTALVASMEFFPNGNEMLILSHEGYSECSLYQWDFDSRLLNTYTEECLDIEEIYIDPTGDFLALIEIGRNNPQIWIMDLNLRQRTIILEGHQDFITCLSFSPDGKMLASGSWDLTTRIWDLTTGTYLMSLEGHSGWITDVAISSDSRFIITTSKDGSVKIWDLLTGMVLNELYVSPYGTEVVAISPDMRIMASAGKGDGSVQIWGVAKDQE